MIVIMRMRSSWRTRLANADHLYGFAAECGLKALMTQFGMPVDAAGSPQKGPNRVHVDKLWARYSEYVSDPSSLTYQLASTNYFDDWRAEDRYAADGYVTQARLDRHRDGAAHVRALVRQARVEGLLS